MIRFVRRPMIGLLLQLASALALFVLATEVMSNTELLKTPIDAFMKVAVAFGRLVGELMVSALEAVG